jgi:hypothetical protein
MSVAGGDSVNHASVAVSERVAVIPAEASGLAK